MSSDTNNESAPVNFTPLESPKSRKKILPAFRLSKSAGANGANDPMDVQNAERALAWAGYYPSDVAQQPIGRAELDTNPDFQRGIIRFQRDFNLTRDALMQPGGETERALNRFIQPAVERYVNAAPIQKISHDEQSVKNDQERSISKAASSADGANTVTSPNPSATNITLPILTMPKERIRNILANKPARFNISENPNADASSRWYESSGAGKSAVALHASIIAEEARRQNVSSDLIKAIMYAENARGHYFGAAHAAEGIGKADSYLPMNIRPDIWHGLGISEKDASNPRKNIRAGVTLIKRIQDRIDNPTPEKIASIWNYAGREKVNNFGAFVGRIFREKPWKN